MTVASWATGTLYDPSGRPASVSQVTPILVQSDTLDLSRLGPFEKVLYLDT